MKRFFVTAIAVSAICMAAAVAAAGRPPTDAAIVHLLNRMAFGPRPGDVERVRAIGIRRYVDAQLHPERVSDRGMTERLAGLDTLDLPARDIVEIFERQQVEARRARKDDGAAGGNDAVPARRRNANTLLAELAAQKLLRAVYSERQLEEVLTDFWFNHFNVDARKGRDRYLLTAYERDTIRPRVLGSFRDLLGATAKSPAMLFYLDNWMSVDPDSAAARNGRAKKGLNENYARELMELHTLGVDGGYTQKDVSEVARAFTGWTIENARRGGGFVFDGRLHDPGQKVVLGHVIAAGGGESDGERVLDILAAHPSTARFIAAKLVRRFVSDTPPPALVDRAAKRFRDSHGDLREVMRAILTSREFASPGAYAAKVKSPFEFVVSALRAAGAASIDATRLVRQLQQMGMPLYMCQPPTGYSDTADAWLNTGALVNRINFALQLARGDEPLAQTLGAPEFQKR
jgi:uncharacterized protein (DUF1800 family)